MGQVVHPVTPRPWPPLILASASPRRLALLTAVGIRVEVRPATLDESLHADESAHALVLRLARDKSARARLTERELVLAADTVVFDPDIDPAILGKPRDAAEARAILHRLAGREHRVVTGFHVSCSGRASESTVTSRVRMRPLRDAEIDAYVATGEALDKAGAYGIQGLGAALIEEVAGSYSNVVGLPMREVIAALAEVAFP